MALVTHPMEGSFTTFTWRPTWDRGINLKPFVSTLYLFGKNDIVSLKRSTGASTFLRPTKKPFKVSAFQGNCQKEESGDRTSGSKSTTNSIKLSYVSQENEEIHSGSSKQQNHPLSYASDTQDDMAASKVVQRIFKRWLTLLHSPKTNHLPDRIFDDKSTKESIKSQNEIQKKERGEILKEFWCFFMGLDASVRIPLLIFIPWYLTIRVMFGAEVSKELTPMWIFGPLAVSLYIKILQGLCALYISAFKQTVKVFRRAPTYVVVVSNYVACGKLKEDILDKLLQPVLDIKLKDYKEISKRKINDLKGWFVENYLNFVELIWPFYFRTLRFLKRAHLI